MLRVDRAGQSEATLPPPGPCCSRFPGTDSGVPSLRRPRRLAHHPHGSYPHIYNHSGAVEFPIRIRIRPSAM